jgi:hypothetical protein
MEIPTALSGSVSKFINQGDQINNLARLGSGLDESPTVMVGEATKKNNNLSKKGAY